MTDRASSVVELGDVIAVLGLLTHSPLHSRWIARDIINWVLPPLVLGQFTIMRENMRPVAYASWAFVSDEVHEVLRTDSRPLLPHEWQSGAHVWVVDFIAPFGHTRRFARLLRTLAVQNGLQEKSAHWKRRYVEARHGV